MNVVVTCLLVSVSGDAQSPFPDAQAPIRTMTRPTLITCGQGVKTPLGKNLDARRRGRAQSGPVALASISPLFYN